MNPVVHVSEPIEDTIVVVAPPTVPECTVPELSLWELFRLFLSFGVQAWGGPVAQIARIKERLVLQDKWIPVAKFNQVLAVYQALPGPEATELACYFGYLCHGRLGALVGGLGFILPGFVLMIIMSWIYKDYGLDEERFRASMHSVQPAVVALVFRAVHRIAEGSVYDAKKDEIIPIHAGLAIFAMIQSVAHVPFYITLAHALITAPLVHSKSRVKWAIAVFLTCGGIAGYIAYTVLNGVPTDPSFGFGKISSSNKPGAVFLVGLMGGLLTFGGAYTTIPFVREESVTVAGWLTSAQFLDGLALGSIIPAPLVMFATFVGFMADNWAGAVLCTLGMFLPAFSFTIIGPNRFWRVVASPNVNQSLEGITACVVGLVVVTALQLLRASVRDQLQAVIFMFALSVLYRFTHKFLGIVVIFAAALSGQILFIANANI